MIKLIFSHPWGGPQTISEKNKSWWKCLKVLCTYTVLNAGLQCRISFAVLEDFTNRICKIPMEIVLKYICRLISVEQFWMLIVFVSMFLYRFVALENYYQTISEPKVADHSHGFFFWMGNFNINALCALIIELRPLWVHIDQYFSGMFIHRFVALEKRYPALRILARSATPLCYKTCDSHWRLDSITCNIRGLTLPA